MSAAAAPEKSGGPTFMERMLDGIERAGNKMPNPAILFLALCVVVIILSQVLYWFDVKATYQVVEPTPVVGEELYVGGSVMPIDIVSGVPKPASSYHIRTETAKVRGLLTGEGVRYLFISFVSNFRNFAAVAIMLVVMIGVGLAEATGLIGALIRKLVGVSSASSLTFIIVLLGIISSIASDAGYLVLIPLGAAAFLSVGRHPLAGIAAAFAGVAAGFGVNFLITPLDGVLTEITNDASGAANSSSHIDLAANLYFGIGSTIFVAIVLTLITARLVEPRLGTYDPSRRGRGGGRGEQEVSPEAEARGLRYAALATLVVIAAITLLTAIPGAPLRNPVTDAVIGDSPFMDSLIVIISLIFFGAGLATAAAPGRSRAATEMIDIDHEVVGRSREPAVPVPADRAIHRVLQLQRDTEVAAVKLGDGWRTSNIGAVWLLIGLIIVTAIVNLIIPRRSRSGPCSRRSSSRSSYASASRRKPCLPPTASATRRPT